MSESGRRRLDDDALLALLGDVLDRTEPLDGHMVDRVARDAFALRTVDSQLAELIADSLQGATGVRSGDGERTLVFGVDGVLIELQLATSGELHGRVEAPAVATCAAETVDGTVELTPDRHGAFELVVNGPRLRLLVSTAEGRKVVTPWIFR